MVSNEVVNFKKQIFLLTGLFFSFVQLNAMCPQTVGSVTPGEGIWQVTSRIGEAANVIQSQLCALDLIFSVSVAVDCIYILSSDIGAGGIYSITSPGVYCLREDVNFSTGSAITISSSDVVLDLQRHTIDGGDNPGTTGIELGNGIQNVTITNGTLKGMGGTAPNGTGIRDSVGNTSALQNITIQDIEFNDNSVAAISFDNAASSILGVNDILIENCVAYNSGAIRVQGYSGIVQNCLVEEVRGGSFIGGINLLGTSALVASNFLIQDCISTSSLGANIASIFIQDTRNATIRNCLVEGFDISSTLFGGIFMFGCQYMSIIDCAVRGGSADGLGITVGDPLPNSDLVIERCVASECRRGMEVYLLTGATAAFSSVQFIDCLVSNNTEWGFTIAQASGIVDWSNVLFKRCNAMNNGSNGFLIDIENFGSSALSQVVLEDCVSQDNTADGFALQNLNAVAVLDQIILRNCVAQNNTGGSLLGITYKGDGFDVGSSIGNIGPVNNVILQDCIAQDNVNGFNFAPTATLNKVLHCCAMNNTGTGISNEGGDGNIVLANSAFYNGTDITGVSDPSLVVSRSNVGAIAGATYWVNVVS